MLMEGMVRATSGEVHHLDVPHWVTARSGAPFRCTPPPPWARRAANFLESAARHPRCKGPGTPPAGGSMRVPHSLIVPDSKPPVFLIGLGASLLAGIIIRTLRRR